MKQEKKVDGRAIFTGSIIGALVVAIAVFAVMLHLEKKLLTDYEKGSVYVATKEIPKGLLLDERNVEEYLTVKELDVGVIPDTAIRKPEQIIGLIPITKIEEGVVLSQGMFEKQNEILSKIKEPVIAGFKAEDLYQVVGGVLRSGDRIHIYNESEEGLVRLKWSDIYVQQVFNSAGMSVDNVDMDTAVQRINIYLAKEDVERFYTELETGMLRVVKVCE
ncbi:MAG: hypothetical protein II994_00760 [Lachnospiraceae bacterium]|nr:hypothetical protein [Lachnospiraceae bacterium]